jgi:Family of unknown function (DUF5677)
VGAGGFEPPTSSVSKKAASLRNRCLEAWVGKPTGQRLLRSSLESIDRHVFPPVRQLFGNYSRPSAFLPGQHEWKTRLRLVAIVAHQADVTRLPDEPPGSLCSVVSHLPVTLGRMNQPDMKRELLDALWAIDAKVIGARPDEQPNLTNGKQIVVALLVGCIRLHRAVSVLLAQSLGAEARILARTLLQDAVTLSYLHRHRNDLEKLALRILYQSLNQQRGLERQATSLGLARPAGRLEAVEEDIGKVKKLAKDRGVAKLPRLPDVNAMLHELDAPQLYWFYQSDSHFVHSSIFGLAARLEWSDEERVKVLVESDASDLIAVGTLAGENTLTAVIAAAHLLEMGLRRRARCLP